MRSRFLLILLLLGSIVSAPAEAATTCTLRKVCSGTAADGTWAAFTLPAGTAFVIVEVSGAAYVDGPEAGYTDGASRSSGGRATTSGEVLSWPIRPSGTTTTVWVAGNGASRTVTIVPFGTEAD